MKKSKYLSKFCSKVITYPYHFPTRQSINHIFISLFFTIVAIYSDAFTGKTYYFAIFIFGSMFLIHLYQLLYYLAKKPSLILGPADLSIEKYEKTETISYADVRELEVLFGPKWERLPFISKKRVVQVIYLWPEGPAENLIIISKDMLPKNALPKILEVLDNRIPETKLRDFHE